MKKNFAEVSLKVINLFVRLCLLHAEHKPITSRVKEVINPLQAPSFLSMLEIDLMDVRNLPCTCLNPHKWVINVIDHHSKFVNSHPLHAKSATSSRCCKEFLHFLWIPEKILTDNGGEFCNAKLKLFCEENQIKLSHGAAKTPTTQGLVERSSKIWKENMRSISMGSHNKNIERWCELACLWAATQASVSTQYRLHML